MTIIVINTSHEIHDKKKRHLDNSTTFSHSFDLMVKFRIH